MLCGVWCVVCGVCVWCVMCGVGCEVLAVNEEEEESGQQRG